MTILILTGRIYDEKVIIYLNKKKIIKKNPSIAKKRLYIKHILANKNCMVIELNLS